jgi:glycosyltransferase involved in cell wall biosynthesis
MRKADRLISVIMPNFNHGKYLEGALGGIRSQSYGNFEVLITDDGSKDNSKEIIERFASVDSRIRPNFFSANRGAVEAANDAMSRARGSYVYQAAADDALIHPKFFENAVCAFAEYPSIGGYYGKTLTVDATTSRVLGGMGHGSVGLITPDAFVRGFLSKSEPFFVPGTSVVVRRGLIDRFGGYLEELGPQVDYYLNHVIPSQYGAVFVNEWIAASRQYADKRSFSGSADLRDELMRFRVFALKMKALTARTVSGAEWDDWWKARFSRILLKRYPFEPLE